MELLNVILSVAVHVARAIAELVSPTAPEKPEEIAWLIGLLM